jgi:hypothetical protein
VDNHGWRTSLIAPARELSGKTTQVVIGLIKGEAGLLFAIRIGEHGETVTMPDQSANELISNARLTMTEKLRIENGGKRG